MPSARTSIGTRAIRAAAWAYGSYVGGRLLVLVATAVLAHLLTPGQFGLVALALVFTAFLQTLQDLGLSEALVAVREQDERKVLARAEGVFSASVGIGAALSLLTVALSPLAAAFFHEPKVMPLLAVLGLNFLLTSLGSTHYALAQRRLDFRARTIAEFSDVIVRGSTGVVLALLGFGAWSIVIGYLAGTMALTTASWLLVPWRPALVRPGRDLNPLLRFGGALTALDIMAAIITSVDYVLVGRVLGTTALGLYVLGFRLPELLIFNVSVVAGQVLYPAYVAVSVDRRDLGAAFLVSIRYTLMVGLPLAVGLVALARPFTLAALGPRWRDSIPVMQILSVYALWATIGIPAGSAYKATRRVGILLRLAVPRLTLVVVAIALFVHKGIVAVAICQVAVTAIFAVISTFLASRLLEVSLSDIWRAARPAVTATAVMAIPLFLVARLIEQPWPALLAGGATAVVTYIAALWRFEPDALGRLWQMLRPTPGEPDLAIESTSRAPT
jgi:O-antigen/teichoic acid export membrane protein